MDPRVVLDETMVRVDPGARATVSVRILNPSPIVEGYDVDVLGDAAGWALVLPPEVSVFPGDEAVVEIAFDPPASAKVKAGSVPFAVRVRSRVDPANATVVEGDLEVGGFRNIDATIGPKTSRGRRSGKHHVDLTNWGNEEVAVELFATDPDEHLNFVFKPARLYLPVGTASKADVKVKAAAAFVRGPAQRKPFTVTARLADAAPDDESAWRRNLDATFEQRALLPGWVLLLIPLLAIAAAGVIWYLNRPEDVSSASSDAEDQPPAQPVSFTVAPVGPGAMTVSWEPTPDAESYNVLWVEPATRDAATPTVFQTTAVPGTQNSVRIEEDLESNTEYCFQLEAVNAAGESPRTPPQCATTQGASDAPPPEDLELTYLTDDHTRAELTWTDVTGGEAEHVVVHDGVPLDSPIPAGETSVAVDLAPGPNCFEVFSQQDDQASATSEEVCIDGPGTDTDGTATTGTDGTGEDLGWITVVFSTQIGDPGAAQAADARRDQLIAAGYDAAVLNSLDYEAVPDGADGNGSLLVYIGGFPSQDAARTYCEDHAADFSTGCLYYQPGEPST